MLCWMVDASPQAGVDWLLTLQVGVGTADALIAIMDAANELIKHLPRTGSSDVDTLGDARRQHLDHVLQTSIKRVPLTPAALGQRRSGIQHKMSAFMHQLVLACRCPARVRAALERTIAFCTDMGTELGLADYSAQHA